MKNKPNNIRVGALGESICCKYLENRGFKVLERNYRKTWGEIDIVVEKAGLTRFIEVKTVSRSLQELYKGQEGQESYRPEDNVHPWKLKRLSRTVQSYLTERRVGDNWQFDVMTVYLDEENKKAKVDVLENIILE